MKCGVRWGLDDGASKPSLRPIYYIHINTFLKTVFMVYTYFLLTITKMSPLLTNGFGWIWFGLGMDEAIIMYLHLLLNY